IWVYSEPAQGTTVKIYLPRVRDTAISPHAPPAPAARGHETLLLVEDEPGVRTTARASLVDHGYTVLEAASGEEALALLDRIGSTPIQLLVTDVVMPLMKGQELAQRFRGRRPGTPVLFTSGYTDSALGAAGVLPPGVAFLQKPFSPEALARKVREVLDQG
ncbi:MAG: response regulator, partial [Candidatus Rokuibacteriota bacterium]